MHDWLPGAAAPIAPYFLSGRGKMGALMRAHDWSATPLGSPEDWPEGLRILVGVMLGSNQPMFIAWGPERTLIYNDAYAEILVRKHPAALGRDYDVVNIEHDERYHDYWRTYHQLMERRGVTQDGFTKPELYAPGAHIVANLAPGSAFTRLCPTCVRDGGYIQAGGTSLAAPVVAGVAALILGGAVLFRRRS